MAKKVEEQIRFRFLLRKMQLGTLILLRWGIFRKQYFTNKIKEKSLRHNILKIQNDHSSICGFYCLSFIEIMLPGKILVYTNLLSCNDCKNNDKIR